MLLQALSDFVSQRDERGTEGGTKEGVIRFCKRNFDGVFGMDGLPKQTEHPHLFYPRSTSPGGDTSSGARVHGFRKFAPLPPAPPRPVSTCAYLPLGAPG